MGKNGRSGWDWDGEEDGDDDLPEDAHSDNQLPDFVRMKTKNVSKKGHAKHANGVEPARPNMHPNLERVEGLLIAIHVYEAFPNVERFRCLMQNLNDCSDFNKKFCHAIDLGDHYGKLNAYIHNGRVMSDRDMTTVAGKIKDWAHHHPLAHAFKKPSVPHPR